MIKTQYFFSGFSLFAIFSCSVFIASIITTSTSSITASRPRGIAAFSLASEETESAFSREQHNRQNDEGEEEEVKCKTEQGTDVDWFIVYKLPKVHGSSKTLVRAGLAYAYILPSASSSTTTAETRSSVSVSAKNNASGHQGSFFGGHGNPTGNGTLVTENKDGLFGTAATSLGTDTLNSNWETNQAPASGQTWVLSEKGIDSPDSMVGQTLGKLYVKGDQKVAFFTYNDQPPVGPTSFSGGHSKGVILSSLASGGIWIQHSVPHFPLIDSNNLHYQYPSTGKINGQVFHCISFSTTKNVDDLAKIFEITKPHIANYSFPTDTFRTALPQLFSIVNHHNQNHLNENNASTLFEKKHPISQQTEESSAEFNYRKDDASTDVHLATTEAVSIPCMNEVDENACLNGTLDKPVLKHAHATIKEANPPTITKNWDMLEIRSGGGKSHKAFIKGPSFYEDVYSSWIASTYRVQLDVQSWLNGPHPFVSNCSVPMYSVYNILDKSIAGQTFSTHNDHSKWAMSLSKEQPLVCISDLNRMEHQLKRGGVTVCFTDVSVWTTFNSSIIDVQPCPRLLAKNTTVDSADTTATSVVENRQKDGNVVLVPVASTTTLPLPRSTDNEDNDKPTSF